MTPSYEALRQHYAQQTDARLASAASEADSLTPDAYALLVQEIQQRGLSLPGERFDNEPEADQTGVKWVTLERFRDLSAAIVARGALEAAGISCFLRDENTVRLDWQISNFIGGMRLQVQQQDFDAALAVLNQTTSDEAQQADPLAGDLCPFCGSSAVHREERGFGLRTAALWMFALPLPRGSRYWHCDTCGREFSDADLDRSEEHKLT